MAAKTKPVAKPARRPTKSTIGTSPLDAVIPRKVEALPPPINGEAPPAVTAPKVELEPSPALEPPPLPKTAAVQTRLRGFEEEVTLKAKSARVSKVRATFHLSETLFEECRDAVVALSGPPRRLTLAGFAEDALRRELERLKLETNEGKAFPKRDAELRGGRPIGS